MLLTLYMLFRLSLDFWKDIDHYYNDVTVDYRNDIFKRHRESTYDIDKTKIQFESRMNRERYCYHFSNYSVLDRNRLASSSVRFFKFPTNTLFYRRLRLRNGLRYKLLKTQYDLRRPLRYTTTIEDSDYIRLLNRDYSIIFFGQRWSSRRVNPRFKLFTRSLNIFIKCVLYCFNFCYGSLVRLNRYYLLFVKPRILSFLFGTRLRHVSPSIVDEEYRLEVLYEKQKNKSTWDRIISSIFFRFWYKFLLGYIRFFGNKITWGEHWYGPKTDTFWRYRESIEESEYRAYSRMWQMRYRRRFQFRWCNDYLIRESRYLEKSSKSFELYLLWARMWQNFSIRDYKLIRQSKWMGRYWWWR